jgi:myosin heavy subunit
MASANLDELVKLDDYTTYLKYRRPPGFVFKQVDGKKNVWIPDGNGSFRVAVVLQDQDDSVVVVQLPETQEEKMVDKDDVFGMNPAKFDGVEDCAELGYLSEPTVLHNLKLRYDAKIIYTYSGLFCVSINPYKFFPIYTDAMVKLYSGKRREELAPHVYAVAEEAFRHLLNDRVSQSILITGESGAGKTENTKKVIQFLAAVAGSEGADGELEKQLIQANPLLEALGNAKTTKNNNSSRFGKFIRITFDPNGGTLSGASIVSYLLEKSRVVNRGQGERAFHIFYQMLAGLDEPKKNSFRLKKPEDYRYLAVTGNYKVQYMDDNKEFEATKHAMKTLGFQAEEQDLILRVCAAILHLGNVEFEGDEESSVKDPAILDVIADLLGLDAKHLESALVSPRILAGGRDLIATHLTPEKAASSRDALAKALYGRLFLWVVSKINDTLKVKPKHNFIGILDIAGFEIFVKNSFEQMCINFTNERLQQFFNNHMFNLEQEEYKREKIEWKMMNFGIDSQATIDLISKKPKGVLVLLDEESVFPKATDKSLTQKLVQNHGGKHPKFQRQQLSGELNFEIIHYAGTVEYDTNEWLEKNRDPLQHDLEQVIKGSSIPTLAKLFVQFALNEADASGAPAPAQSKKGAAFITVAAQYREQLNELMDTLGSTYPHFIRCIIPNHKQEPLVIDDIIVLDQLRCNGVLEGIKISRMGYPNRLKYAQFLKRYYLLVESVPRKAPDPKAATKQILTALVKDGIVDESKLQYGLTKIFFRTGELPKIEEARERKVGELIPVIQACARGYIGRKYYKSKKEKEFAVLTIQRCVRAWLEWKNWPWFRLWMKAKPKIKRVDWEAELKKAEEEGKAKQRDLDKALQERATLESKMKELDSSVGTLQGSLRGEKQRYDELQEQFDKAEDERGKLKKKITEMEDNIADKTEHIADVEAAIKDLKQRLSGVEGKLAGDEESKRKLNQIKAQSDNELNTISANLEAERDNSQKLAKANRKLLGDLDEANSEAKNEESAIDALNRVKKKLSDELDKILDDLDQLAKEKAALDKTQSKLQEDLKDAKRDLDAETNALNSAANLNKKLQQEFDDLSGNLDREQKNVQALDKAKKALQSQVDDLSGQLEDAKNKAKNLDKDYRKLSDDLNGTLDALDQESATKDRLTSEKTRLESTFDDLAKQLSEANAKIARLEKEKQALTRLLEELKGKHDDAQDKLSNLEKNNKKLQGELQELEDLLSNEEGNVQKVKKLLNKLESDQKALQRELDGEKDVLSGLENSNRNLSTELDASRNDLDNEKKNLPRNRKLAKTLRAGLRTWKKTLTPPNHLLELPTRS